MDMDELFDLDFAFTMPQDSADKLQPDEESTAAARRLVDAMPAAAAEGDDSECMVCLQGFRLELGTGRRMPCAHVFHHACISHWLSFHNSCPLCRRIFLL